jgi:hypothetical protein
MIGSRVITPDGKGKVIGIGLGKCMGKNVTGQLLVKIDSDKYWPHNQVYYKVSELKTLK